jgi:hypothetical protein
MKIIIETDRHPNEYDYDRIIRHIKEAIYNLRDCKTFDGEKLKFTLTTE